MKKKNAMKRIGVRSTTLDRKAEEVTVIPASWCIPPKEQTEKQSSQKNNKPLVVLLETEEMGNNC